MARSRRWYGDNGRRPGALPRRQRRRTAFKNLRPGRWFHFGVAKSDLDPLARSRVFKKFDNQTYKDADGKAYDIDVRSRTVVVLEKDFGKRLRLETSAA